MEIRHATDHRSKSCHPNAGWRRAAFTRIELLITIALILALATLYWRSSLAVPKNRLKDCELNLQKIHVALQIYAGDYRAQFPVAAGARTSEEALDLLVPRYSADTGIFICPGSRDKPLPSGEPLRDRRISYAYYMGRRSASAGEALASDRQVDTQSKTPGMPLFSSTGEPPGNNHPKRGGNILFCDGHVEATGERTVVPLVLTPGVTLLNPKP